MISTFTSEKSLINILLQRGDWYDKTKFLLSSSDFSDENFSYLFKTFGIFSKGGTVDWTWESIADHIQKAEKVPIGLSHPLSFLADIISVPPVYDNFDTYVAQINDRKNRVKALKVLEDLKISFEDSSKSTDQIYTDIRDLEEIFSATAGTQIRRVDHTNLLSEVKKDVEHMISTPFIGTGFNSVDQHLVWGLAPGLLSLIGGRPSMGKSLFRSNVQNNMAKNNVFTITVTREQSILSEYFRLIAIEKGMDAQEVMKVRNWTDGPEYAFIPEALKQMATPNYPHRFIKPTGLFFLRDIRREIIDSQRKGEDPKVIFIDMFEHLDDFTGDIKNAARNIQQKLNEAADMAVELNVHMCLLAQLRRGSDKGPLNDAWKNSGGYEERARLTFQVFRPGKDDEDIEDNTMFVSISKQSDGPTPTIHMGWNPSTLQLFETGEGSTDSSFGDGATYF